MSPPREIEAMQSESRISIDETFRQLETTTKGLTSAEVQTRLTKYGRNEITGKKVSALLKFLRYFWGPIP